MELSPKQQISELIKQSLRILVVTSKHAGGDAVGSMLALERVLAKAGKEVTLVLSEVLDENLSFLPGIEKIKKDVTGARDLIIRVNKNKFPVEKLSYNEEDGFLNIVLTPAGSLEKSNLEFVQGEFKFDLIFVLDTADVEKIDAIYDRYTELFFETPIVNVDHHSGNEYFGTVNMVDLTATSTAEILVSIIESMGAGNFDADVATCLLTGIIADTASFKNTNTTPKSLTISAQMLAAGARQQEVIQNLYKTRPLSTLKLWGRVLSNMSYDQDHRMVVSTISLADFNESGGNVEEIHGVMDELLANAPGTDVVLLLAETAKGKITGKLKGMNGSDVLVIAEAFGGSGHVLAAGFDMANASLAVDKDTILAKVRTIRDRQLGRVDAKSTINNQQLAETKATPTSVIPGHQPGTQPFTPVIPSERTEPRNPLGGTTEGSLQQGRDDNGGAPKFETRNSKLEIQSDASDLAPLDSLVEPADLPDSEDLLAQEDVIPLDKIFPSQTAELEAGNLKLEAVEDPHPVTGYNIPPAEFDEIEAEVQQKLQNQESSKSQLEAGSLMPKATTGEDEITQAIKSIDDEIEGVVDETPNEITPNIDIEGTRTKKETLQQIGEVIRGYNPGRPVEGNGEQPVDPTVWK